MVESLYSDRKQINYENGSNQFRHVAEEGIVTNLMDMDARSGHLLASWINSKFRRFAIEEDIRGTLGPDYLSIVE